MKLLTVFTLVAAIAVPSVLSAKPADTKADEIDGQPMFNVAAIHTVTRNDGGGAYGTHTYPSYKEDGVQYFRTGDIVEVNISLPKEHGATVFQDLVVYDKAKVELLSGYYDIRSTLSSNYSAKSWSTNVSAFNGDPTQLLVFGSADDYTVGAEWLGGSVARMYFRVLPNVETEEGTPITFSFPLFQTAGYANGKLTYTHMGYDAERDAETAYYKADPISIVAKKPSAPAPDEPKLLLKGSSATIYEGDFFIPSDHISEASCSVDQSVNKDTVTISEGTGKFTKHQPTAGTYTFKYKVDSSTGLSTEKSLELKVVPRTYTVQSVETDSKRIKLATGTSSKDMEALIEKMKTEDFDVTVNCNDGSSFVVPGKVVSGKTDTYRIDENENLLEQEFNVNVTLGLPLVSYSTDGERVVTPYSNARFTSNVGTGTVNATVAISVSGDNSGGNTGGNSKPATAGNTGGASGAATSAAATGDATNTSFLALLAILSTGVLLRKKLVKK